MLPDQGEFSALVALGSFLAGLALFFHGLDGVKSTLTAFAGRSVRRQIARFTGSPALAGAWGFGLGMLTQSATAAAFLVTGMVGSGALVLRRGLGMVAWANVGTVLLPFLAAFDIVPAILYTLGTGGLLSTIRAGRPLLPLWRGTFMVGLLMLGLELLKQATAPVPRQEWFVDVAALLSSSLSFGFLLGVAARLVIQSTSAIVVIVVALTTSDLFTEVQGAMVVHGTGVGVGITTMLLGSGLRGLPRQLALFQACINSAAGVVLAAVTAIEAVRQSPGVTDLFGHLGVMDPAKRMALAFAVQQGLCVVIAAAFSSRWESWLARWSPPTTEEDLASPRYLALADGCDAQTALDLVAREQSRIVACLPDLLDGIRGEGTRSAREVDELHKGARSLGAEVREAIGDQMESSLEAADSHRLLALDMRQRSLDQLLEEVARFAASTRAEPGSTAELMLTSMTEGLHAILTQLVETDRSGAAEDRAMLAAMTGDRGPMLEQVRGSIAGAMDAKGATGLLYALSLFERNLWLVGRIGGPPEPANHAP
ncbi:MAG: hypothetical protein RL148_2946 [Planctomycetota bacterium]|jgi:phosphate:Na+ symporter